MTSGLFFLAKNDLYPWEIYPVDTRDDITW